jgi:hypothetical protein
VTKRGNQSSGGVEALLAGAERGRTRVRGFAPWQPSEKSVKLLGQVRAVLGEYAFRPAIKRDAMQNMSVSSVRTSPPK